MKLYSVTQVLSPYVDFSKAKPEDVEAGGIRGTDVHRLSFGIARGLWCPIPPEYEGYIQSFQKVLEVVDKIVAIEPELVDEDLGFVGHPDFIWQMRGVSGLTIPDLKTSTNEGPTWCGQMAAYKHLAIKHHYDVKQVISVRLQADGKRPRIKEYTDSARDLQAFLGALTAYRYFKP